MVSIYQHRQTSDYSVICPDKKLANHWKKKNQETNDIYPSMNSGGEGAAVASNPDNPSDVMVKDLEIHLQQRPMSSSASLSMNDGVEQLAQLGTIISSTFGAVQQQFNEVIEKSDLFGNDVNTEFDKQKETISKLEASVHNLHDGIDAIQSQVSTLQHSVEGLTIKCDDMASTIVSTAKEAAEAAAAVAAVANSTTTTVQPVASERKDDKTPTDEEKTIPSVVVAGVDEDRMQQLMAPLFDRIDGLEASLAEQHSYNNDLTAAIQQLESELRAAAPPVPVVPGDVTPIIEKPSVSARLVSRPVSARPLSSRPMSGRPPGLDEEKIKELITKMMANIPMSQVKEDAPPPKDYVLLSDHLEEIEQLKTRIAALEEDLKEQKESTSYTQKITENQIADLEVNLTESNRTFNLQIKEHGALLSEVQETAQASLGFATAIKRVQSSMNDAVADIDELKYKQSFYNSEDAIASNNQKNDNQKDAGAGINAALESELVAVKQKLMDMRDDLDTGLDGFADAHAADPEGSEAFDSEFIAKVAEFADHLDAVVIAFDRKGTPDVILDSVFRPLDLLTIEMEQLFDLDKAAVAAMGITFDDLTPEASTRPLRATLQAMFKMCLPILDHRVDKITMRRRVEKLEILVRDKADTYLLTELENELRNGVNAKADRHELLTIAAKKVSMGELQRLKDQLMKQIVGLRGEEGHGGGHEGAGMSSEHFLEFNSELKRLRERFDVFHNLHEDLATQCDLYVPREEVEQALRALLNEMKLMKTNSVSPEHLKESLKMKANSSEVQK